MGAPAYDATVREAAERFVAFLAERDDASERDRVNEDGSRGIPELVRCFTETETAKLFTNTHLALRISYFNELNTHCEVRGLSTSDIIGGVRLELRIGSFSDYPSFGYGVYCLPKDTKQSLANYRGAPQNLIEAIVDSHRTRKDYVADEVLTRVNDLVYAGVSAPTVDVHRLTMQRGADNFRVSSAQRIMKRVKVKGVPVVAYKLTLDDATFFGSEVTHDPAAFKRRCDLIVADRWSDELADVVGKVYARDLFRRARVGFGSCFEREVGALRARLRLWAEG